MHLSSTYEYSLCVYVCINMCVCMYQYVRMYVSICVCMYVSVCVYLCMPVYICLYVYIYTVMYVCICMYVCIHLRMCVCILHFLRILMCNPSVCVCDNSKPVWPSIKDSSLTYSRHYQHSINSQCVWLHCHMSIHSYAISCHDY